jgi:hypothetical protein
MKFSPNMNFPFALLDVLFVDVASFVVICSIHLTLDTFVITFFHLSHLPNVGLPLFT